MSKICLFSGTASIDLATQIAAEYRSKLGHVIIEKYSDKEMCPSFETTIRGCDVYIIQSTPPPFDNWGELFLMLDGAKRASANKVIAVIPYFGYARQDRKDKPRVPIGAKLMANLLQAAGADRVLTMDLHAGQIQGFFDIPVDSLFASQVFIPYIKANFNLDDICIATPDIGGAKRASKYAEFLNIESLAIISKQRAKANVISKMTLIGDVTNKDVILVDDLIDTAGTLCKAAELMMENGARSVRAMCTHPVLSGKAYENIYHSQLKELIITNTLKLNPLTQVLTHDNNIDISSVFNKIKVLSVAPLFADVISRIQNNESISSHFDFSKLF